MADVSPAHCFVRRNVLLTESYVNLVLFAETSSATFASLRKAKYFVSHSKERSVKNTVLDLFLLPTTVASRDSKSTSSRFSLSTSEIRIPVAMSISTNALRQ